MTHTNRPNRRSFLRGAGAALALPALWACSDAGAERAGIRVARVPGGGIVPAAAFGPGDALHLAYMQGQDVFHASSTDFGTSFSAAVRVNDRAGQAQGGLFRGPEMALGSDGTIHLVWYNRAWELSPDKTQQGAMYARAAPGAAFEPSRNVGREPSDGFSIAARDAQVAIAWHNGTLLKVLRSGDAGRSFTEPASLDALPCECCDTQLHLRTDGSSVVLFRDRLENRRDMFIATLAREATTGRKLRLDAQSWIVEACPMSGSAAAYADDDAIVAWERAGRILLSRVRVAALERSDPVTIGGGKYPIMLRNADATLVAWCEGKKLTWQLYDSASLRLRTEGSIGRDTSHRAAAAVSATGQMVLVV